MLKFLLLFIALIIVSSCSADEVPQRPNIEKLGTIDCDLVETTPVVFNGELYRFEYVRPKYYANKTGDSYFRFINHKTGAATPSFARGYHLGSAFVFGDSVYVTAVDIWDGENLVLFVSGDLQHWKSRNILNLPGWGLFNTSLCKADNKFVLMFEVGKPAEVAGKRFTARFAESKDLINWQLTDPRCTYTKERYSAPHALRYFTGYFYDFFLEAHNGYEMRVVRSRDLINWQLSSLNPVLKASAEDKIIFNENLSSDCRNRIKKAKDINNSDIDFCEFKGNLIINYSWGNQQGEEFLAEAIYHGTLKEFLEGWFPE
jgi:hypothetical protein